MHYEYLDGVVKIVNVLHFSEQEERNIYSIHSHEENKICNHYQRGELNERPAYIFGGLCDRGAEIFGKCTTCAFDLRKHYPFGIHTHRTSKYITCTAYYMKVY